MRLAQIEAEKFLRAWADKGLSASAEPDATIMRQGLAMALVAAEDRGYERGERIRPVQQDLVPLGVAARHLRVTVRWLRAQADAGAIPALRTDTGYHVSISAVEADLLRRATKLAPGDSRLVEPVDNMELSSRTAACLYSAGIKTVGDLAQKSRAELLKIKNFGRKSLKEVQALLAERGLEVA